MDKHNETASKKVQQLQQQHQKLAYEHNQLQKKLKAMQRRRWITFAGMMILIVLFFSYQQQVIEGLQRWDNYRNSDGNNDEISSTKTDTDNTSNNNNAENAENTENPEESETTVVVKEQEITDWLRLTGKINPIELLEISSPMETTVKKMHFRYGESVTKGQLLLELDTLDQKASLRTAEAKHITALKEFKRLKNWSQSNEMFNAKRQLEKARHQLQVTQKNKVHTQALYDKGIITRIELEAEEQRVRDLEDSVTDAKRSLQTTKEQASREMIRVAALTLENAKYQLSELKKSLRHAKIYSPKNGIIFTPISNADAEKAVLGKLYNGIMVKKNSTLFVVASLEGIMIETEATEKQLLQLKQGTSVIVSLDINDKTEINGKISHIAERAEDTNDGEGAIFKVRVKVDKISAQQHGLLKVGMTANIKLKSYHNPKAIVVPFNVLEADDAKQFSVYLVNTKDKNAKPEKRSITIRQTLAKGVEVSEGLQAGDVLLIQEK